MIDIRLPWQRSADDYYSGLGWQRDEDGNWIAEGDDGWKRVRNLDENNYGFDPYAQFAQEANALGYMPLISDRNMRNASFGTSPVLIQDQYDEALQKMGLAGQLSAKDLMQRQYGGTWETGPEGMEFLKFDSATPRFSLPELGGDDGFMMKLMGTAMPLIVGSGFGAGLAGLASAAGAPAITGQMAANAGLAGITGGNPATAALTAGASGLIPNVPFAGVPDAVGAAVNSGLKGGVMSAATGGDPLQGALIGATAGGLGSLDLNNTLNEFTYTANGGDGGSSNIPVSVNAVGNDFLNSLVAQNQGLYAGADSLTGGGPTTPAPASFMSGVNNPFQFMPVVTPQRDEENNVEDWSNWMLPGDAGDYSSDVFGAPGFDMDPYTLTDAQQWAKGVGALNEDGSINWGAIDSGDPFGMGSTDGAPVVPDAGIGLGGAGKTAASAIAKLLMGSNADGSTRSFFDAVGGNKGLLPSLLPAALGAYGANQQAQAYRDVSDKYMAMGAPFRQRLADSYGAGFKASDIPGYNEALDSTSNAIMRKLSTTGNPFDNPGGLMEANRYVMENTALPAINNYRSQLGTFGQLGTSTGGTAALGAIPAAGGVYDAIGAGLYNATKEQDPFATTMAALYRSMLPGGNYKLNAGMGV